MISTAPSSSRGERLVTTPTACTTGTDCSARSRSRPYSRRREPLRQLLERVEHAVVVDEPHDVAVEPPRDLDDPVRLPLLERLVPRQVAEVGLARARDELECDGVRRLLHDSYLPRRRSGIIPRVRGSGSAG